MDFTNLNISFYVNVALNHDVQAVEVIKSKKLRKEIVLVRIDNENSFYTNKKAIDFKDDHIKTLSFYVANTPIKSVEQAVENYRVKVYKKSSDEPELISIDKLIELINNSDSAIDSEIDGNLEPEDIAGFEDE